MEENKNQTVNNRDNKIILTSERFIISVLRIRCRILGRESLQITESGGLRLLFCAILFYPIIYIMLNCI